MSRTKADNDRIDRLASEKRGGGGLVLPPLFSALMNELLDHGTATDDRMAEIVAMECESKTAKLDETWDGDWSFLTRDLMDSLSAQELVARNRAGAWMVGPEFEPGILTEVLPARKNLNAAQSFTAWDAETRAALRSAAVADAKFYEAIRQPRGKFHGPDTLRALRESYEREGPRDPVLVAVVDGYEVVIDGRHRLELDAKWPKKVLHHVTTREQAIGAIIEADDFVRTSVLPTKARAKLAELIGELGKVPTQGEIKRLAVERELVADAARSNRAIAELVGVQHNLVGDVRSVLDESSTIHQYEFPGSAKTGKHSTDCWCGNGDYTPKEPKPREPVKREQKTRDPELIAEIRRRKETGQLLDRDQLIEQFGGSAGTINSAQSWVEGRNGGRGEGAGRAGRGGSEPAK